MVILFRKIKCHTFSDREALVTILTQPKNSIIAQYKHLFELDECELVFTDDSLDAIAELAIKKRTGLNFIILMLEYIFVQFNRGGVGHFLPLCPF